MGIFEELEVLGFFEWLDKEHNLKDNDFTAKIADELASNEIHLTVMVACALRWFRDKHMLKGEVAHANSNGSSKFTIWKWNFDNNIGKWERISHIGTFDSWETAELSCLKKLIELIKEKQ